MKSKLRKLGVLGLGCMLALNMAVPALALPGLTQPASPADITIVGTGKVYQAYQILDLTTALKVEAKDDGHETGKHDPSCYNYSYTLNDKYGSAVETAIRDAGYSDTVQAEIDKMLADGELSEADVIAALELMGDPGDIRLFANKVYALVKNIDPEKTISASEGEEGNDLKNKVFVDMPQGYYLIVEREAANDPDAKSLVMLDTAGQQDITINSKEGVPTLTKEIKDTNDTTGEASDWQDAGDFDIGDDVEFRLTGTLPANIDGYTTYDYIFHDNLSAGLALNADSFKVTADGNELLRDTDYTVRVKDNTADGCSFEVQITNVKGLITAGLLDKETGKIIVEYTAKLTDGAKTGIDGNENTAFLEFSNDPYDSDGHSNTPEDRVIGFTFKLTVDKTDKEGRALAGAGFQLKKWVVTAEKPDGEWTDYPNGNIQIDPDQTTFEFMGLDSGRYLLTETKVPAGYNKADDVEFEVVATYTETSTAGNGEDLALTGLEVRDAEGNVLGSSDETRNPDEANFVVTLANGDMATVIINSTGVHLPTTGGAGAYLVYGLGAVAVIGGGALYINSKKKKDAAQK